MNRSRLCYLLLCSQSLLVLGVALTCRGELWQEGSEHRHLCHLFLADSDSAQADVWGSSLRPHQKDHRDANQTIAATDVVAVMSRIRDIARHGCPQLTKDCDRLLHMLPSISSVHRVIETSTLPDARRGSLASIQGANEFTKDKCEDNDCTFLDLRSQLGDTTGHLHREFTRDGMHLNTPAYREWARAMLPLVAGP